MRREEECAGKVSDEDGCGREEKERKTRPKQLDSMNVDLREKGLSGKQTHNRAVWIRDFCTPQKLK